MPTKKPTTKKPVAKIPAWMKTWKMLDKDPKGEDNFFLCIGMTEKQEVELTKLMNVVKGSSRDYSCEVRKLMALGVSDGIKQVMMLKIGATMMKMRMDPMVQLLSQLGK